MLQRPFLALALGLAGSATQVGHAADLQAGYQQPSTAIRELLDAPNLPRQLISPDRQTVATLELRRFNTIEELARPVLRLAGQRFDPANASPQTITPIQRLKLRSLLNPDAAERLVELPAGGGAFHSFAWAPDGQRFVVERRAESASELWVGDTVNGRLRPVAFLKLNNVLAQGDPIWLSARELVVLSLPDKRGLPPAPPRAPAGPAVQESLNRNSPERTYPDLLKNSADEAQFEYHARSMLTVVDIASGISRDIGTPGLFSNVASVGDGQFLLTERLVRPFSYSLPWDDFPRVIELRQRDGKVLRELARVPLKTGVALEGVVTGPRLFFTAPHKDGAIYWVEALDGGNPANKAAFRDRIMKLDAPYKGEPQEVQRMPHRFARLAFLDDGQNALLTEIDRARVWTRTYLLPLDGSQSKPLFDHSLRERYRHPGTPMTRTLPNGRTVVIAAQGELLMTGPGAGPKGERPFLDRFSLRDLSSTRVFQSGENQYEQPLLMLDGGRLITQRESITEVPNLFLRDGTGISALTRVKDPSPQLRKIRRELVTFKRADGVDLSFWLYLPPDYREGERRPALVWAYPLEFADAGTAGQVTGSANRFASFPGLSPLNLLMDGYVILSDATMPVVGDPKTVNDTFVEQITANARAIIDKAEELGSIDTKRMAVGGHSYGAFMTVNLLAHTDLFKAGIARSGAYNRTLTPFGFQSERRSLWDARDVYLKLSPFLYAHQIKEPLLLTHGEADNNSGTFPIQTERLYQAMAGTGGTVRYVSLPFESHGYTARESVGHVQAEMSQWLKTYLGDPRAP